MCCTFLNENDLIFSFSFRYKTLTVVEHSAVNRVVARSSWAGGAKNEEIYSTEIAFLMEVRLSFG